MKQNDWIIANINNPDFTVSDFKNIGGLSLDNTQLLPIDQYLKNDKVVNNELFKDSSGQFNKDIFKNYYNNLSEKFNNFAQESSLDNYEYGFWDVFAKPDSRIRNPQFDLSKVSNPTHQSTGVLGLNIQGEKTKSDLELAEKQKIYDWTSGEFKDETPEDNALFSNPFKYIKQIFSEPLVLAKYEENTEDYDPFSGELIQHKKGENKINSEGEYYFETLGGRSIQDKQVLSLGDIITKEDQALNKYDFFDSDDIEKSPEGVIAKNLTAIAPMAFLGPVGSSIYSGFYVGRELLKTLPMLYNIGTMLSDGETPSMLNTLAGFGQSLTGSTSEYGRNNTFSFENFGNLISDVALQWGQQKFIANSLQKLRSSNKSMLDVAKAKAVSEYERQAANVINSAEKGNLSLKQAQTFAGVDKVSDIKNMINEDKWASTLIGQKAIEKYMPEIEKAYANRQKLGQDLSLIYMAMISNTDVFDSAIEHGATKTEAAILALGSMAGMFTVDKYLGLGEMFFDDEEAAARRLYRQSLKESIQKDVNPVIQRLGGVPTIERESKNSLLNLFNKGKESTIKFLQDYKYDIKDRSLSILGKSVGEGLEEVSEEAVTDIMKSLYQLGYDFGITSQQDIGAWDNMGERYLMSLLGGTVGGGLFAGVEAIRNPKSTSDKNSQKELLHLVREGRTADILKELERMKDRGMLGNKELSINTTKSQDGNYFISADENNISQNDFIYNQMKSAIQQMDKIINGNQLGLTEDQLFERMLLSDIKLMHVKDFLKDSSYMSGYFNEYEKIVQDIYNNEVKIQELESSVSDPSKRNSEDYKKQMENLLEEKQKLLDYKDEFFKNKSQRYLRKTIFGTNANISGYLLPMTYNQYVQLKFGKEEKYLSENQKQEAKNLYDKYLKTKKQKDFDQAFEAWDEMTKKINPTLQDLDLGELDIWKQARDYFQKYIPDFKNPSYDERVKALNPNIELQLKKLGVIKTSEYDKPWKSDPSKSNKAFDLQLSENPSMFFQIVKDHEDKYWSIHFKTDNPKVGEEGQGYSGLNESQKIRLFQAAALVIPEGEYLSTYGELTPGGISGLNRFGQKSFVGDNRFIKSGVRKVKTKGAKEFSFVVSGTSKSGKTREGKYNAILDDDNFWHIKHEGTSITRRGMSKEEMSEKGITLEDIFGEKDSWGDPNLYDETINNFERFDVEGITIRPDGTISLDILDDGGDSFVIEGNSAQKIYNILFPDININNYQSQDIEIPIWQKVTRETDEEYENRNKPLEGESEEDFSKRKQSRINRLKLQAFDKELDLLQQLLESDATIDSNTYRYIVSRIKQRAKDIKISTLRNYGKNTPLYSRLQEVTDTINDDLSNVDEIWNQLETLFRENYLNTIKKDLADKDLGLSVGIPKDVKLVNGYITFNNAIEYIKNNFEDFYWDEASDLLELDGPRKVIEQFINNLGIDQETKNDLKDFINIQKYQKYLNDLNFLENQFKENPTLENEQAINDFKNNNQYNNGTYGIYGIQLSNKYQIQLDNGEPIQIEGPIDNINYLLKVAQLIKNKYTTQSGEDGVLAYSNDSAEEEVNSTIKENKKVFEATVEEIKQNKQYNVLSKLPEKISKINRPTLNLLKSMANKLGVDFSGIEETLQTIVERFNELPEASDFRLSDSQIDALENAKNIIELAKAAIIAASGKDSYFTPWNYNKTINEWNKAHKSEIDGEIEELPELDENTANILLQDLHQYQIEINAWISRATENGINKIKMFKDFDNKYEEVKLKFVMENRHKFILDDGTDLMEGFNEKENPKESVLEFERIFYQNVQKAIANGKSEQDLFNAIKNSINWTEAIKQKTSKMNLNLEELTDYDKFIYLVSCMIYNPDNFYTDYKKFVENNKSIIAPLSFQKNAIRIIKSQENNPEFFNTILKLVKNETGFEGDILENTVITTGIGGAGKSSVVIKGSSTNNVVISGPTETQIDNLKKYINNPKIYSQEDLLKLALGDQYDTFISEIETQKNGTLLSFNKMSDSADYKVDVSKVKIETMENPPKQIIIDEATLFNNAKIQVLSKFCKLNGIQLLLAGDENQNGDNKAGWNISREFSLAVRTPKLGMSLRENNLWKYQNQDTLQNLEDTLRDTDTGEETQAVNQRLLESDLQKFKLKYYFKDGQFYGDMIINSEITDDQINSIKWSNNSKPNVCFVGSTSSEVYKKLKASGKNFDVKTLEGIQGYEYDYVICDIDWKNLLGDSSKDPIKTLGFMQSLYTILTRSKDGTMLVNNGLLEIIGGNAPQNYNSPTTNLNTEAIEQFSKYELDWINNHKWNPQKKEVKIKSEPLKKDKIIEVEPEPDDPKIKPVEGKNNDVPADDPLPPKSNNKSLPIHVYSNFNYLGINRRIENKKGVWFNEDDSYRDIGIFLRKGTDLIEDEDKQIYVDKLLDLKSSILFQKFGTGNYVSDVFNYIPRKNLENATYWVVREEYDLQKHHLITEEQDLEELPEKTIIYTLQCRFKDSKGNDCSVTLATLPKPDNMQKDIYRSQIQREYNKLKDSEENKELRDWYHSLLENEQLFNQQFTDYENNLNKINNSESKEKQINKPDFIQMTGLRDIGFHMRLEEVNSVKSRYDTRNSGYVISPIYAAVDSSVNNAGMPFILVTADRSFRPENLIEEYEKQLEDPNSPLTIRQVMLDSMGVSFESLFDHRYADSFNSIGSGNNTYTFPFDLLPTGLRMYIALHNFRANLIKLHNAVQAKYPSQNNSNEIDFVKLNRIVKEESRLYQEYKEIQSNGTTSGFRIWLKSNKDQINTSEATFDEISELWDFNDNDLKNVKQFRLGYDTRHPTDEDPTSQPSGVYVRTISDGVKGNYINPAIAEQWLGTINKIFDVLLDRIIPPESLTGIGDITEISNFDKLKDLEGKWVKKLEEEGDIILNLDEESSGVTIHIPNSDRLRAIPVLLTQVVKNLQDTQKVSKSKFSDYDTNPESHYAITLNKTDGTQDFVHYLEILKGGLGEIGNKLETEPGVYDHGKGKLVDKRLVNMFNVAFHGAVSLWTNKENVNDFLKDRKDHAKDVLFPYGFFVDPILGGSVDDSKKFRIINIDRKYYATNRAPSGAKAFISFDPIVSNSEEPEDKKSEEINNEVLELKNKYDEIFGTDNWVMIVENIETKQGLIKAAKRKILEDKKLNFGNNSTIDTLESLLNMPIDIDDNGNIIFVKNNELLNNINSTATYIQDGETFVIKQDGNTYIIESSGNVIKNKDKVDPNNGIITLSIEGFIDSIFNEGKIEDREQLEELLSNESDFILNGSEEQNLQMINGFKQSITDALKNNIEIYNLEDSLDNYINGCQNGSM